MIMSKDLLHLHGKTRVPNEVKSQQIPLELKRYVIFTATHRMSMITAIVTQHNKS